MAVRQTGRAFIRIFFPQCFPHRSTSVYDSWPLDCSISGRVLVHQFFFYSKKIHLSLFCSGKACPSEEPLCPCHGPLQSHFKCCCSLHSFLLVPSNLQLFPGTITLHKELDGPCPLLHRRFYSPTQCNCSVRNRVGSCSQIGDGWDGCIHSQMESPADSQRCYTNRHTMQVLPSPILLATVREHKTILKNHNTHTHAVDEGELVQGCGRGSPVLQLVP